MREIKISRDGLKATIITTVESDDYCAIFLDGGVKLNSSSSEMADYNLFVTTKIIKSEDYNSEQKVIINMESLRGRRYFSIINGYLFVDYFYNELFNGCIRTHYENEILTELPTGEYPFKLYKFINGVSKLMYDVACGNKELFKSQEVFKIFNIVNNEDEFINLTEKEKDFYCTEFYKTLDCYGGIKYGCELALKNNNGDIILTFDVTYKKSLVISKNKKSVIIDGNYLSFDELTILQVFKEEDSY